MANYWNICHIIWFRWKYCCLTRNCHYCFMVQITCFSLELRKRF